MFQDLSNSLYPHVRKILVLLGFALVVGISFFYVKGMVGALRASCGDSQIEGNEQCDDGNTADGDGCSATCQTACGDGILAGFEQCDDGNTADGDGCSSKCLKGAIYNTANPIPTEATPLKPSAPSKTQTVSTIPTCGDGIVDKQKGEICEPGELGEFCPYGQIKPCKVCRDCKSLVSGQFSFCGDGKVDPLNGEECDLGKHCADTAVCAVDAQCEGLGNGKCLSTADDGCSDQCKNEPKATPTPVSVASDAWTISVPKPESQPSKVLVAGVAKQKVATYLLNAKDEKFTLKTLTLINDPAGAFDAKQDAPAVKEVTVECSSANSRMIRRSGPLEKGSFTISNFYCPVRSNTPTTLDIFVDLHPQPSTGTSFYGQSIRLGIQNPGLLPDPKVLEATGAVSKASANPQWFDAESIEPSVIRKTAPAFANANDLDVALENGSNSLYGLKVTASRAGSVSLGGLTFLVSVSKPAAMSLTDFRLFKLDSLSDWSQVDANLFSERGDIGFGSDNPFTGGLVGVSFNTEEIIPAGESQTYVLKATVAGASITGASVTTQPVGDTAPLALSNSCGGNPSTGRIYDTNGSALFNFDGEFSFANRPKARTIWSDRSASSHAYPTVSQGIVTAGSGSCDWTNGWGLGLGNLEPHTLVQ